MDFPLEYCPDGQAVIQRLGRLYADRAEDLVCARMEVPNAALAQFARTHKAGFCDYPDPAERLSFWDAVARARQPVRDDSIPSLYLSEMDQGLYGGLLGGDVRFLCDPATGTISSMVSPILDDWGGFDRLSFSTGHPWFTRYATQLRTFANGARGRMGVSHLILINGMNFVFELMGATQAYLAMFERPEMIRRAFELAYTISLQVHRTFFEHVGLLQGGTCSNLFQWLPGQAISESVDPFHMTSVDCFEEWGRGPLERILGEFDGGGITHLHGNGRHLLEAVCTVAGLKAIFLGDDRGFPSAFKVLPQLKKRAGDMPLGCLVGFADFERALNEHRLTGGVFYWVSNVPDADTANRTMDRVRAYRI